jgi:hypothetical protein
MTQDAHLTIDGQRVRGSIDDLQDPILIVLGLHPEIAIALAAERANPTFETINLARAVRHFGE